MSIHQAPTDLTIADITGQPELVEAALGLYHETVGWSSPPVEQLSETIDTPTARIAVAYAPSVESPHVTVHYDANEALLFVGMVATSIDAKRSDMTIDFIAVQEYAARNHVGEALGKWVIRQAIQAHNIGRVLVNTSTVQGQHFFPRLGFVPIPLDPVTGEPGDADMMLDVTALPPDYFAILEPVDSGTRG